MPIIMKAIRNDGVTNKIEFKISRKLIVGNSGYCDIILEDKSISKMQCEIIPSKSGHVIIRNLDLKKEVFLNTSRLKRSALKVTDTLKIGPFVLIIDPDYLTEEELSIINSEYEEFV